MKISINLIIGIFGLFNIIYHLFTCPLCDEKFFGMTISGPIYLGIWIVLSGLLLRKAYQENTSNKQA